ncbi:MAG: diguanylate phosphodiesterase [Acidobacteria bacterium]|nr:diguanylate phosphodiesterase [Acidobacteriota bacterium]
MPRLIQLIYCSAARKRFGPEELVRILDQARLNNARCGVTGMLLYADGSFFQVLEGEEATVDALFESISRDDRHGGVTLIIREPVARRSFGDWTMGYAEPTAQDMDAIVGTNDFFSRGESFEALGPGRARKLLEAFRHGRWRTSLSDTAAPAPTPVGAVPKPRDGSPPAPGSAWPGHTFAFQPIVNTATGAIFSYEALIRGKGNESAACVLNKVDPARAPAFHERIRVDAVELAARLGLSTRLNINFLPSSLSTSPTAITSVLEAAERCGLRPDQIVLEILESEIIHDIGGFTAAVNVHRHSGLVFALDDFGAGHAGLNLLADFQPDLVKLDMHLVRGIESRGPRQAIVRGIARTCADLGIEIIAEGVETVAEHAWLRSEGIELFQGMLFAGPAFEELPAAFHLPGKQAPGPGPCR